MQPGLLVTCLVQQLDDKLGVHVHTVTVAVAGDTAIDARVVQLAEQQPLCLCYSAHRHLHTCTDRCLQLVEQLDPDSLVKSSKRQCRCISAMLLALLTQRSTSLVFQWLRH